ncbi:MAG TPA: protein kinase, partial [Thermoguttaceae bacterium]|nr:protein kinase [Thermoguttaceae bacterium]
QYLKALSGHPRIVVLMDVWTIGGYLVTRWELAPDEKARSLEDLLKHYQTEGEKGVPLEPLLRYMGETAEGIDFLNGQGIYHRDIKPANLLLFWDHVKIGDLGLAKFVGASMGSHSGAGTMGYLPPEAYRGQLTPTVDLYSLAATYLKLRTGREPFGQNPDEILQRQKNADPIMDGLSQAEAEVVRKALAPDPADRPQQGAQAWCRRLAEVVQPVPKPAVPRASKRAEAMVEADAQRGNVSSKLPEYRPTEATPVFERAESIRSGGQGPMEQAVTFGVSAAVVGAILGGIAGAILGALVWALGGEKLGPASLGAIGGGLIGAAGGGFLGGVGGAGRTVFRAFLTVIFGMVLGTFLGVILAVSVGGVGGMVSTAILTAVVGAVVWAVIWAILGALLGAAGPAEAVESQQNVPSAIPPNK